jgi:aminoglycoside phosphotransferase (APT) family kinase protein
MTSLPETVITEFSKAIKRKPTDLTVTLRKPLDHQSNCLYDIWAGEEHFIGKVYLQIDELESAPKREFQALTLLSSLDIAPQPIYYEPSIAPVVIYRYMEGEMWGRRCVSLTDLSRLMDVWLKVHSVPAVWYARGYERSLQEIEDGFRQHFRNYLDWAALEFEPGKQAAEMILKLLESRECVAQELADYTPVPRFCRSDPRFANVIQRPNGTLGMVDWEDSGLLDPARQLADFLTHPNQEDLIDWPDWQAFVTPYLTTLGEQDSTITRRTYLYLEIFPFFWMMGITKGGIRLASTRQLTGWTINGIPGNVRLRRYLARAISWPEFDYGNVLENLEHIQFFPNL